MLRGTLTRLAICYSLGEIFLQSTPYQTLFNLILSIMDKHNSQCRISIIELLLLLLLLLLLSRFSRVRLCETHRRQPTRLLRPWDSPGKNTGVGCHFLLQCMEVKGGSEVAQSCLTLSNPMDYNLPGSSIHGIFQARVLEWGAIAFSDHWTTTLIKKSFLIFFFF